MSPHEGGSQKRQELTFRHFSHIHPLQLSNYDESKTTQRAAFCAACKLKASGWICSCKDCNFFLHFQCSIAPQHIRHPFYRDHNFSLIPDQALFNCHACGNQGFKFAYGSTNCKVYLHFDCARTPQVLNHQSHHHTLDLAFSLRNESKTFDCKVCRSIISNCWRYKCDKCEFNAHLECAKSNKIVAQISSSSTASMKKKESNYNTSPPSKEEKSSGATTYKGKEKGSNSGYTHDRPFNQKQFGNRPDTGYARGPAATGYRPENGGERRRYTQDTSRINDRWDGDGNQNANRKIYASSNSSGAGGGSGYWQQNSVHDDHSAGGYGSDDIQDDLDSIGSYSTDEGDGPSKGSNYNTKNPPSMEKKSSGATSYQGKEGSNKHGRNFNQKRFGNRDAPFNQKRFGNRDAPFNQKPFGNRDDYSDDDFQDDLTNYGSDEDNW